MNKLIRKAENPTCSESHIVLSHEGFPMFPAEEGIIKSEFVKKLEEEQFLPTCGEDGSAKPS